MNLADRIGPYYAGFRERRAELEATPNVAETILAEGAAKVRPIVEATMKAVRTAMSIG
jgi:hypothetical protein